MTILSQSSLHVRNEYGCRRMAALVLAKYIVSDEQTAALINLRIKKLREQRERKEPTVPLIETVLRLSRETRCDSPGQRKTHERLPGGGDLRDSRNP